MDTLKAGPGLNPEVVGGTVETREEPRVDLKVRAMLFYLRCNWTGCYGQEQ